MELPDSVAVKAAVRGSTDEDTVARADAALAVMQCYVSARSGQNVAVVGASEGVPPLAAQRFEEYRRAQTQPRTVFDKRLSPTALKYFQNTNFHVQLLSKLVSSASVAAYRNTPLFQELAQDGSDQCIVPDSEGAKYVYAACLIGIKILAEQGVDWASDEAAKHLSDALRLSSDSMLRPIVGKMLRQFSGQLTEEARNALARQACCDLVREFANH